MKESKQTEETVGWLAERLTPYSARKELYQWWPRNDQLTKLTRLVADPQWVHNLISSSSNIFTKTLTLRENIERELKSNHQRLEIAKWIIRDWGGIETGRDDQLEGCITNVEKAAKAQRPVDFARIASWSKYLAFKFPSKCAIYDARAIYSLNWFLFRMEAESRRYYPMPPGRNSVMDLLNYQMALVFDCCKREQIVGDLKSDIEARLRVPGRPSAFSRKIMARTLIAKADAYWQYCELVRQVADTLYSRDDTHGVTKVEMILFSLADKDVATEVVEWFSSRVVIHTTAITPVRRA